MPKASRTALHRLNGCVLGTQDLTAATGVPINRYNQWVMRGLLRFAENVDGKTGSGRRRQYLLIDIYLVRLIHSLSEHGSTSLPDAIDIAHQVCFPARYLEQSKETTDWLRGNETDPEDWAAAVADRVLADPWYMIAAKYPNGWRVTTAKQEDTLANALSARGVGYVDGKVVKPTNWLVLNMTAELAEVDRILRERFQMPAEGDA